MNYFSPQSAPELQLRFERAIDHVHCPLFDKRFPADSVATQPEHHFDLRSSNGHGWRTIVSVDEIPAHGRRLHASISHCCLRGKISFNTAVWVFYAISGRFDLQPTGTNRTEVAFHLFFPPPDLTNNTSNGGNSK